MWDAIMIRGTAWLSLALWALGEWLRRSPRDGRGGRATFTLGLLAMVVHSLLAFALSYGWSHAAALEDAARRTAEVTGRSFPRGFYANHAFLAWWTIEAAAWWWSEAAYRGRPRAVAWASRAVFAFMFANGAVVFAPHGPARAYGVLALSAAVAAWVRFQRPR